MGKVEIDHTGSGSGITLSSDGTSLLLDGTAIGGADLYAANESSPSAQPSATGANAIAIGDSAIASDVDAFAGPLSRASGEYSVALGIGNSSSSYGAGGDQSISIGNQSRAMALQSVALGSGAYVDSDSSRGLALGENSYVQQCDYGTAIGAAARVHGGNSATEATAFGSSYASGTSSFAAAIANNTSSYGATGANSIAIGSLAKATASDAVAIGDTNIASGVASFASGRETEASANYGRSGGYGSLANVSGDAWASGYFGATGDAQNVKLVIRGATSNTTPVVLTPLGGAVSGSRSLILETYSAYAFSLMVVARRDASDGTESAAVKIEGLIRKENNDASITLVSSNKTTISNAPSWAISVIATAGAAGEDNGGLDVVCADLVNGHNIRWVGTLKYTKVTYA